MSKPYNTNIAINVSQNEQLNIVVCLVKCHIEEDEKIRVEDSMPESREEFPESDADTARSHILYLKRKYNTSTLLYDGNHRLKYIIYDFNKVYISDGGEPLKKTKLKAVCVRQRGDALFYVALKNLTITHDSDYWFCSTRDTKIYGVTKVEPYENGPSIIAQIYWDADEFRNGDYVPVIAENFEYSDYANYFFDTNSMKQIIYCEAARKGDLGTVQRLFNSFSNDDTNSCAVRVAIGNRQMDVVDFLLDHCANIYNGMNWALLDAVKAGNTEMAQFTLDSGADVHAWSDQAIWFAIEYGHIETVKLLLKYGATAIPEPGTPEHSNPLLRAVYKGNTDILKLLVKHNLYAKDSFSEALCSAAGNGNTEIVEVLIDAGAEVDAKDGEPLLNAVRQRDLDMVKLLVKHGANIHAKNDMALREAAFAGDTTLTKIFLELGVDNRTEKAISVYGAAIHGHTDTVELLLEYGAENHFGNCWALQGAAERGRTDVVKVLLDHGVADNNNKALHIAKEKGHTDIVKLLEK